MIEIKRRERDAILQSLQAGLVPRLGLHLIQVGRKQEVEAMLADLERIEQGGATFRIVVGRFGSGKSFFMNLVRNLALQKRMVVVQADMSMERRLQASGGEARALYSELVKNLAIKNKPDGGALRNLCEGWISTLQYEVTQSGGTQEDVKKRIFEDLKSLQDHVGGFEFTEVLAKYYEGYISGNDALQGAALRWLRAEYTTKTEARQDLGVRRIIDDENFYDSLKLLAAFSIKAGHAGLLVNIDEMVVLSHRMPSARSRQTNYESLLTILNDCLQGSVRGLGFMMAGTDECLEDKRRGLYSYEALRSRLAENRLAGDGVVDFSGPVVRLQNLAPEELLVLLQNIRNVHAYGDHHEVHCAGRCLGGGVEKGQRNAGRSSITKRPGILCAPSSGLLNVLEQNPNRKWQEFLDQDWSNHQKSPCRWRRKFPGKRRPRADGKEELASFKL